MNDRNFEDREKTGKILSLFYETLYLWTAAYVSPLSLSYSDFPCSFCSTTKLLVRCFLLYTSYVLRAPYAFLMRLAYYLSKKKKG
jgi:hypothetical protein